MLISKTLGALSALAVHLLVLRFSTIISCVSFVKNEVDPIAFHGLSDFSSQKIR